MSLTFEEAVQRLEAQPARSQVVPVRITAHGEDGTVLYGYGGLLYEAPEPRHVWVAFDDVVFSLAGSYAFEGGRLTTEYADTNARVRLLNNQAYDTQSPDNWLPPGAYQSFLITRPEAANIQIGWASKQGDPATRRLILRVVRGIWGISAADIELDQRDDLLTGLGALSSASTAAVWTVSFLDPIPRAGNEIG